MWTHEPRPGDRGSGVVNRRGHGAEGGGREGGAAARLNIMKTILTLIFVGFVLSTSAQIDTNKPARFKTKIACSEVGGGSSVGIDPSPEVSALGSEYTHVTTAPQKDTELKCKYVGREKGSDIYEFTFSVTTKVGVVSKTTTHKQVPFDGKRIVVFNDEHYSVIIESPSEQDLKDIVRRKQI